MGWALARAQDPMCGTGMLLTEAPSSAMVLGADISLEMISRASAHFRSLRRSHWSLLQADAPLKLAP